MARDGKWQLKFIEALHDLGNIRAACEYAGVGRRTVYEHRDKDPEFAAQWQSALEEAGDLLEGEAWRRAYDGVDEPVYQGGKLVGTIRKYSDTLTIFLLKGIRPEKFRERFEHSGPNGQPLTQATVIVLPNNGRVDAGATGTAPEAVPAAAPMDGRADEAIQQEPPTAS